MLKIIHRVNTIEALKKVPREFGVEMDLHGFDSGLVVHHEPFTKAVDFERWLDAYDHRFLLLNIKEEGIENRVRQIVLARGIEDFFMLDLSFPALIKMVRKGECRVAVRISEYEPVEGALALAGQVGWVWVDVFKGFPLHKSQCDQLHDANFKICLVSPELHGRNKEETHDMKNQLEAKGITPDAVCTKWPELW